MILGLGGALWNMPQPGIFGAAKNFPLIIV